MHIDHVSSAVCRNRLLAKTRSWIVSYLKSHIISSIVCLVLAVCAGVYMVNTLKTQTSSEEQT